MGLFARISGLNKLVERFPVEKRPEGEELIKQTVQIGLVRYRSCVTVIISGAGLYLSVKQPLSTSSELFIPWNEIKRISSAKLFGRGGSRLSLGIQGEADLVVYDALFASMRPYVRFDTIT